MPTARYWEASRLLLTWAALLVALAIARWSMTMGTYQAAMVDRQVVRTSGLWSPAFASGAALIVTSVVALFLLCATYSWVSGRDERRARLIAAQAKHRRVLM